MILSLLQFPACAFVIGKPTISSNIKTIVALNEVRGGKCGGYKALPGIKRGEPLYTQSGNTVTFYNPNIKIINGVL